jgi:UDP-N-acetylmuramyl pentapeptide synthase
MAELAQQLGISTAQIRQYLTINAKAHRLQSIQLQENQMILEIAPDPSKGDN